MEFQRADCRISPAKTGMRGNFPRSPQVARWIADLTRVPWLESLADLVEGVAFARPRSSGRLLFALPYRRAAKGTTMARSFYLGTDAELYTGSESFSTKITATPTAYGLVAAQATAYAAKNTAYAAAYVEAVDPETRTKGKVEAKNEAKRQLRL